MDLGRYQRTHPSSRRATGATDGDVGDCLGGKRDKLRPGDILGALTGDAGIAGNQVGKINVLEFASFVALDRHIVQQAYDRLSQSKIKGRLFKMRLI
ncbi:DbpA RNA binding domain-containing protein [Paludibacterium denitrificans]|uniref:DbpA RNA binding domain-containing protein n=1 Tax=Paludibacterium denitrificans TaxID=2675226 RepID=UPI0028A6EC95|nr:DbpA RNA binding domain-containing protein [Paludibacterium denitrificans]